KMAAGVGATHLYFVLTAPFLGGCWSLAHRASIARRDKVLAYAEEVIGSRTLAEEWFARRAIGLADRSPCSLVACPSGYESVIEYLFRIDRGVYC
ncbi:DUF2384 domain-containing protein, partial [Pseudomonas putida]|nr:DUF2384 domain-containing protein [Pseudomonas putida]